MDQPAICNAFMFHLVFMYTSQSLQEIIQFSLQIEASYYDIKKINRFTKNWLKTCKLEKSLNIKHATFSSEFRPVYFLK